jgi:hypothetical protein
MNNVSRKFVNGWTKNTQVLSYKQRLREPIYIGVTRQGFEVITIEEEAIA